MKISDIFENNNSNWNLDFQGSLEDPTTGEWIYPSMNADVLVSKGKLDEIQRIVSNEDFTYNGQRYKKGQEIEYNDFHDNETNRDWAYGSIKHALENEDGDDNFNEPEQADNGGFPPRDYNPMGDPRG